MRCSRSHTSGSSAGARGFSLLELLFALAIGALLLGLALPAYREHLLGVRRSLARAELMSVHMRQAQFFIDHKRYATVLTELGMPAASYSIDIDHNRRPPGAAGGIYLIALAGDHDGYDLYARPQGAQAADSRCGVLGLDHLGVRTANGAGSIAQCW